MSSCFRRKGEEAQGKGVGYITLCFLSFGLHSYIFDLIKETKIKPFSHTGAQFYRGAALGETGRGGGGDIP